jgi:uncharacterized repeat protein (TIGR03806 family)
MISAPGVRFVVEQGGTIQALADDDGAETATVALDLRAKVEAGPQEAGLLGLALHPRFAENGLAFLSYTARSSGRLVSRITRIVARADRRSFDPATEELVLELAQPADNHNGGHLAFGPDGFLYVGFGDGGGAGDPFRSAQDPNALLGKLLRLDVDRKPYAIPADNPFARGGGRGEIFALGFRNPWRFSFDRARPAAAPDGLWLGDVGQDAREEVDLVVRGGDYGWSLFEGTRCFRDAASCAASKAIAPIAEYGRDEGISITGGYVYRGRAIPGLVGTYVFGDFGSGSIFALSRDPATGAFRREVLARASGKNPSSFAEAANGELYLLSYGDGEILRIDPGPATSTDLPRLLSQTGCMDPNEPWKPRPALVPYEVNAPLFSDGASKDRWFAIPDGTRIEARADGTLDLPIGSVAIKHFTLGQARGGRRLETRFMMRHPDGGWGGYSYRWRDDQRDAELLDDAGTIDLGDDRWSIPGRGDCMQCHGAAAGTLLGLKLSQINREVSGRNQIAALESDGFFTRPLGSPATLPRLPAVDGPGTASERARAYLDGNCAGCHRPGGLGRGTLDLRYETPLASAGLCDRPPTTGDLGIANARLLAPGAPERSTLVARIARRGEGQMPPLASSIVDPEGLALVRAFVRETTQCPTEDRRRTVVLLRKETRPGQDLFLRGGLDHEHARGLGRTCTATNFACALPITHRIAGRGAGDRFLDWYGAESGQPAGTIGSPLVWTTDTWPASFGPTKTVAADGFGVEPLNRDGPHHWMLDVDMDCGKTDGGWFELKAFVTNGEGWEPDVRQPGAPWASRNHFARCGAVTVLRWGEGPAEIRPLPPADVR